MAKSLKRGSDYEKSMSLKNYLSTFELTNEREQKLFRGLADGLSGMYDSTKQLYHRTPAIVRAGAFVGLGVAGTLMYQKITEPAPPQPFWKTNQSIIFVSYRVNNSGDAKDRPYDWGGFVTPAQYEDLKSTRNIDIKEVDIPWEIHRNAVLTQR